MELRDAEALARELMREYGLTAEGWTFKWGHGKSQFGCTWHQRKLITMSRALTELNSAVEARDTILHEIAHALVGFGEGHGKVWQRKALEIGARPSRCVDSEVVSPPDLYTLVCPNCGRETGRNRKTKTGATLACGPCCKRFNGGKWSIDYKLRWYKTEGMIRMFV